MTFWHFSRGLLAQVLLVAGSALTAGAQGMQLDPGQHIYDAACASCHYRGVDKAPFGTRGPPADGSPHELARYILFGKAPEDDEGGMPAFGPVLTDADITQLVNWLRSTSKPDDPWPEVDASVATMRATGTRED